MAKLTNKQKLFCDEYLIDLNATRAYRAAYPNIKSDEVAASAAVRLLRNVKVDEYIQQRMSDRAKRTEVTQDMVLKELAAIGFSDVADFARIANKHFETFEINADGEPEEVTRNITFVELTPTLDIPQNKRAAIAGIKQGANGIEIKLNDKLKALELLGKHMGMFDKQDNDKDALDKLDAILGKLGGAMNGP